MILISGKSVDGGDRVKMQMSSIMRDLMPGNSGEAVMILPQQWVFSITTNISLSSRSLSDLMNLITGPTLSPTAPTKTTTGILEKYQT